MLDTTEGLSLTFKGFPGGASGKEKLIELKYEHQIATTKNKALLSNPTYPESFYPKILEKLTSPKMYHLISSTVFPNGS